MKHHIVRRKSLDTYISNSAKQSRLSLDRDKVFESEKYEITSEKSARQAVCINGLAIEYVPNPSEEVCLLAVRENGLAIRFIKNPSDHVKFEAIKNEPCSIFYIDSPTEEMIKMAEELEEGDVPSP